MWSKNIEKMLKEQRIPIKHGVWIDDYNKVINSECSGTITTRIDRANHYFVTIMDDNKTICINSKIDGKQPGNADRVYNSNGVAVALTSGWQASYLTCAMRRRDNKKQRLEVGGEHANSLTTAQKDSMVYVLTKKFGEIIKTENVHPIILATFHGHYLAQDMEQNFRIRKLTPRECYRLMDVAEEDIDKLLASDISKSQHYKLAGNSIVVSCLYYIFKNLFSDDNDVAEGTQLTLF